MQDGVAIFIWGVKELSEVEFLHQVLDCFIPVVLYS